MSRSNTFDTSRQPFLPWLGLLTLLTLLSACAEGRGDMNGAPKLPPVELLPTTVGVPYEAVFTASGGTPPLHYLVTPPPGFSFYTGEGRLTGPGTEPGDYALTVSVRDAHGAEDSHTYALKVWPRPEISSSALPAADVGINYEHVLTSTGGRPPLQWSVAEGSLPPGVSLSSAGVLNGLPQERGTYPLLLRVQDAHGATAAMQLELEVRESPPPAFPLSVGNWNIEWFGDLEYGPSNEPLQLANVQAVIADAGVDFWGVVEIVSTAQFNELKARLPGYDGFLADDTRRVTAGTGHYSANDQKVGVLYKSDVVRVMRAEVVLTEHRYEFGGRPPLRVDLRIQRGDESMDVTAFVVHMKAAATASDYARRASASGHLKNYLDLQLPTQRAIVVGDWNDDVDVSFATNPETGTRYDTPYRGFVNAPASYTFTTQALSLAGASSMASRVSFVDHQLVTNELWADHISNSTVVLRPAIPSYGYTTSDHYPIISRFDLGRDEQPVSGHTTSTVD